MAAQQTKLTDCQESTNTLKVEIQIQIRIKIQSQLARKAAPPSEYITPHLQSGGHMHLYSSHLHICLFCIFSLLFVSFVFCEAGIVYSVQPRIWDNSRFCNCLISHFSTSYMRLCIFLGDFDDTVKNVVPLLHLSLFCCGVFQYRGEVLRCNRCAICWFCAVFAALFCATKYFWECIKTERWRPGKQLSLLKSNAYRIHTQLVHFSVTYTDVKYSHSMRTILKFCINFA